MDSPMLARVVIGVGLLLLIIAGFLGPGESSWRRLEADAWSRCRCAGRGGRSLSVASEKNISVARAGRSWTSVCGLCSLVDRTIEILTRTGITPKRGTSSVMRA